MALPPLHVVHSLPGRVRFRLDPELYPQALTELAQYLAAQEFVSEVRSSVRTGSLFVLFRSETESLFRSVRESGLVQLCEPTVHSTLQRIQTAVEHTDERVIADTRGALSLGSLSFFGLLGLGLYQAQRGKFLPAGMTLVTYALEILYRAAERERELELDVANHHAAR
jgi:hypothetical protein